MYRLVLIVLFTIASTGIASAQEKILQPINCYISSQMQMRMKQQFPANFYLPADSNQEKIALKAAVQIDIQTNRNWMLNVRDLNAERPFADGHAPLESLRIRADGKNFMPLDEKEISVSKGKRGAYGAVGNSISIDYELTFKKSKEVRNYQIELLYTLVAI